SDGVLPFSQRVLRRPEHPGSYDIEDPARVDVPCVPVVRCFLVVAERGYDQVPAAVRVARDEGVPGRAGAVSGVLEAGCKAAVASSLAAWAASASMVS